MRISHALLAVAASAAASAAPPITAAAQQSTAPAAATAPTATLRAVFAAAERGDMAALDTLYAGDSLTVIEGAGINRGWADYRDHHLAPEMKEMRGLVYRPADIDMHVSGNVAWATFRYALQATVPAPDSTGAARTRRADVVGRGTAILERQNGHWRLRHIQTSGRARRPSDPPVPSE